MQRHITNDSEQKSSMAFDLRVSNRRCNLGEFSSVERNGRRRQNFPIRIALSIGFGAGSALLAEGIYRIVVKRRK